MVYARPNEAVMKFSRQVMYKDNLRDPLDLSSVYNTFTLPHVYLVAFKWADAHTPSIPLSARRYDRSARTWNSFPGSDECFVVKQCYKMYTLLLRKRDGKIIYIVEKNIF